VCSELVRSRVMVPCLRGHHVEVALRFQHLTEVPRGGLHQTRLAIKHARSFLSIDPGMTVLYLRMHLGGYCWDGTVAGAASVPNAVLASP